MEDNKLYMVQFFYYTDYKGDPSHITAFGRTNQIAEKKVINAFFEIMQEYFSVDDENGVYDPIASDKNLDEFITTVKTVFDLDRYYGKTCDCGTFIICEEIDVNTLVNENNVELAYYNPFDYVLK